MHPLPFPVLDLIVLQTEVNEVQPVHLIDFCRDKFKFFFIIIILSMMIFYLGAPSTLEGAGDACCEMMGVTG